MIRILHVVSTISLSSGVMSFLMSYYRNINRSNIQFDFLYWVESDGTYADEINHLGGFVYLIPKPGISKEYRTNIVTFFKNNSSRYKILHLHEIYLNMFIPPIARKYGIGNIIAHSHTTVYSDKKLNSIRNRLLCLPLKKNTNFYFACSKAAGEFLYGKKYVQKCKVHIINNAIDCDKFRYNEDIRMMIRKNLHIENKFIIGHIGRFNDQKNHNFLIDIFLEVLKDKPNSVLMLVGIGPLKEKIQEKIKNKNIVDRVLFLDQRNDVQELLQAMDAFILPSIFEGLGIVLIEAQAAGLQCFASDVVPIEAKVTDNLSQISLKSNATYWAKRVLKNCNNVKRVDEVEKIRNANFDIKTEARKLEELYMNLTD